jgi:hypothetical protein
MPLHADDERLLGGLDLAATLHPAARWRRPGLLASAAGGVLVLARPSGCCGGTVLPAWPQVLDTGGR